MSPASTPHRCGQGSPANPCVASKHAMETVGARFGAEILPDAAHGGIGAPDCVEGVGPHRPPHPYWTPHSNRAMTQVGQSKALRSRLAFRAALTARAALAAKLGLGLYVVDDDQQDEEEEATE